MKWQSKWVVQQPGFLEARRVLEVGSGAFETIKQLANKYPEKAFFGLDFDLSTRALEQLSDLPRNLSIIKHDARVLEFISSSYFDFVFSVAVMEHIAELELHLQEVYSILRTGGMYCFWEAPFWSCSIGHHFRHNREDCPIPHYAHLYMKRDELALYLKQKGLDNSDIEYILERVWDREDLSRLTRSETLRLISESKFDIEIWEDEIDLSYSGDLVKNVLRNNLYEVSPDDLKIKGAKVVLRK